MHTSAYQLFKLQLMSVVPLAKDAIHIYIGFLALLVGVFVLRKPLASLWVLLPGILISLAMEVLDLRDDRAWLGYFRWGASLKDLINGNAIPLVLVLLARRRLIRP
jgi:hypothetical protein